MAKTDFKSVDEYLATFPDEAREVLEKVRRAIREGVPDAEEVISYQVAAYRLKGWLLIYFAGFKKHYSLFCPRPQLLLDAFKEDLARYDVSKSTIKFPLGEPVPADLIRAMAKHRADEYRGMAKPGRRTKA